MPRNQYFDYTDPQLVDFIANAATVFNGEGDPSAYGLTNGQVTALQNSGTALNTKVNDAVAAEAAFRAAIQAKLTARETALDNVSLCAGLMYATPGVTNEMVAAAGFQPRDVVPTPIFPVEVTSLVATPYANGTVKLEWNRNGNPYGVEFVIETSADGSSWSQHAVTKRKSLTLQGFTPGVTKWFRIRATNRGLYSAPSTSTVIYGGGEGVELSIAA
jgi:hypothetical protein